MWRKRRLLEWLANNLMRFGCALELVSNKTKHGQKFCITFGGIGGVLYNRIDFEEDEAVE